MSTKLRKRVLRSEARVAELSLKLREERAKLARLQLRFSRAVREDSSSDSSSDDSSPARPTETAAAPALTDTGPGTDQKREEGPQWHPPPLPLPIADKEQQQAPSPDPQEQAPPVPLPIADAVQPLAPGPLQQDQAPSLGEPSAVAV